MSFDIKCYTKTFVGKSLEKKSVTKSELLEKFKNSYESKFRNCVLKKLGKKNIKIYTNYTIQTNGYIEDDLKNLLNDLDIKKDYTFQCVMCNWSLKIGESLDLKETLLKLNDDKVISYFLRGYPLIIKYNTNDDINFYNFKWDSITSDFNYNITKKKENIKISVLLFKTGKCIVSGATEKGCFECIEYIKNKIQ